MSEETLELKQLKAWCENLSHKFLDKQILLLKGPLGVGKTELVRQLLMSLGSTEVASPTYALIHHYQTQQIKSVVHVDLYRIESEEDLDSTGFWDLFTAEASLIIIEWPERVSSNDWPLSWSKICIDISFNQNKSGRSYKILEY